MRYLLRVEPDARLSRSYADRALMLTGLAEAFLKLQPQFTTGGPPRAEHEFQFKRLVLRTEQALASELLQWWLLRHTWKTYVSTRS
jgi:hypothetical protein